MLPKKMLIQPDTPTNTHLTNVRPRFLLQRNKRSPSISSPAKQTFMLNLFSNLTNVRPRFLLQLNKCSPSASSPNKHSSSLSSATKQTFVLSLFSNQTFILALFSNQTNVRPRPLFQLNKIRGQGQEGVGNLGQRPLGGASDWASRGEALCVIRGAPWVSDRCPRRAAVRAGHYQLQACQKTHSAKGGD